MHKYQSHRKSLDSKFRVQGTYHSSPRVANHYHSQQIRTGLAVLPVELLDLICRLLCLCSYCEPPNLDPLDMSLLSPVQFKADLDSLTRTCQFIRGVAQPYIFHVVGTWDKHPIHRPALKISVDLPHVANQIRAITLNSIWGDKVSLSRMTGLRRLQVNTIIAGGIGLESQLSFPRLRELCYGPSLETNAVVYMEDARTDLRAILSASEKMSHLRCQRLYHDIGSSPFIFSRLPACKITTLELHECCLPHGTFKRFMANFPCLEAFRFMYSMPSSSTDFWVNQIFEGDGPGGLADAADVVTSLLPARKTLKRLILNFGLSHEVLPHFRVLSPMKTFTALRTVHLSQGVVGLARHWDGNVKEALTMTLPRSIEELFIDEFDEDLKDAVLYFAEQAVAGEFPNLKHVRLIQANWRRFMRGYSLLIFSSRVDALEASGKDVSVFDVEDSDAEPGYLHPMIVSKVEDETQSEESVPNFSLDLFHPFQEERIDVGRRLLRDKVFRDSIVHHTDETSDIFLHTALDSVPLRRKISALFSKANVKFESVGVVMVSRRRSWDDEIPVVWL